MLHIHTCTGGLDKPKHDIIPNTWYSLSPIRTRHTTNCTQCISMSLATAPTEGPNSETPNLIPTHPEIDTSLRSPMPLHGDHCHHHVDILRDLATDECSPWLLLSTMLVPFCHHIVSETVIYNSQNPLCPFDTPPCSIKHTTTENLARYLNAGNNIAFVGIHTIPPPIYI